MLIAARGRSAVASIGVLVALVATAGCAGSDGASAGRFRAAEEGTLAVATAFLPSPGFWEGPPTAPTGGFERALAGELADRFGLDRVVVVPVGFPDLVAGDLGGADIALSQLTPTAEREEVLDFSIPYLSAPPGVLVRAGVEAPDLFSLRRLRWVTVAASTLTDLVHDTVRPLDAPLLVETRDEALAAIRDARADAMLLDLPVALARARTEPADLSVAAQLAAPEGLAVALPDGSRNRTAIDSAVRALIADGTIERLSERWFGASLAAGGVDDIPLVRTGG